MLVQSRISAHRQAEAEKAERLRREEEALAEQRQAEAARAAAAQQASVAPAAPQDQAAAVPAPVQSVAPAALPQAQRADEPATLKLGTLCERLGFTMTAAFVSDSLGISPKAEGASKLYTERQFNAICERLVTRIRTVQASSAARERSAEAA